MDILFYAPAEDFESNLKVELKGQEATHISKVLRNGIGDTISVANGNGEIFSCEITEINRHSVIARCITSSTLLEPAIKKILAFGIIKKRDRLEFAVEKAVELGAWEICLFNADHSERTKINKERLEMLITSAFKQSRRSWLPKLKLFDSIDDVLQYHVEANIVMAHEKVDQVSRVEELKKGGNVLFIGPEGGFSDREVQLIEEKKGNIVSLGANRLRAETAVTALLSQYLF